MKTTIKILLLVIVLPFLLLGLCRFITLSWVYSSCERVIADKLNASLGKRVKIIYEEHKGIPSNCFGDSAYFVQNIVFLEK
jgi:hypothetical protein